MATRSVFRKYLSLLSLVLILSLNGCQGFPSAFTPEAAVQQEMRNNHMPDFTVDPGTIRILQMTDLAGKKIVLFSFQGNRANIGRESCLFSYEVFRSRMGGWQTGGGGGGCNAQQEPMNNQPISIGSGKSGGNPTDVGHSEVYGETFDDNISLVQITWSDGAVQQASIINKSYLAVRAGEFDYSKVEALDANQQPVFTNEMEIAPGKR